MQEHEYEYHCNTCDINFQLEKFVHQNLLICPVCHRRNVTINDSFKKAYDECLAEDMSHLDEDAFIKHCEKIYDMKTGAFRKWFEEKCLEGNSEQQLWYMITEKN